MRTHPFPQRRGPGSVRPPPVPRGGARTWRRAQGLRRPARRPKAAPAEAGTGAWSIQPSPPSLLAGWWLLGSLGLGLAQWWLSAPV